MFLVVVVHPVNLSTIHHIGKNVMASCCVTSFFVIIIFLNNLIDILFYWNLILAICVLLLIHQARLAIWFRR